MDLTISTAMRKILEKQGFVFHLNTKLTGATVGKKDVTVVCEQDGKKVEIKGDRVLVAAGRRPFTDGLGLAAIGLPLKPNRRIEIGARFETSVGGVYAIGDVVDGPMLAHKAMEEGVAVAEIIAGKAGHVNYATIPSVVYTHPEIATVGLTEEECKTRGLQYKTGQFPFLASGRARALGDTDGFVKVIADSRTDRLLGVHILGPSASELIGEIVIAFEFGASAEDIGRACHAHPTLSEAVKEACLAVDKRTLHI